MSDQKIKNFAFLPLLFLQLLFDHIVRNAVTS